MTYPKPIPIFTPEEYQDILKRAHEVDIDPEQKQQVNKLREQL